ncbi:DNA repair protein RecO [Candidatus Nomurabacteria bacterium CG_4_9_14_0_2_um_filter_32_10]|uniref:DNA repair protein RecO n=3 Tax=Candidatus Nomuraibacteriota TaxID=1752729 RepID=A0A2H0CHT6_9BACT|nr:MAG: DNA repair protein RecO [Candidatus Nomurabacteria bacterium CG22_combo_CG10-13_8_21_14_all_32_8]PIZ86483.1 MAG: DNA repair protein RecO [Candidatus Nomurabacteria bacterium CG_4_10_14_0_2_um_filter_33_9]PJC49551.1 MAG: DNA repair protein RecO [Candidatus Nomurabacteria bacterium CG_4_9_14_0_2_um_filter_32_10]
MHHIYHTEGIILGSGNFGETGKYYSIFTRDLGMIFASAQGVRKMSSKLRFVLQDFSYLKIDLIKGKDFWKITSASKTNKLEKLSEPEIFEVFVNISKLLKRLLMGEDPNKALFMDLLKGLFILEKSKTIDELRNIEAIIVLRILNNLGYIGGDEILKDFIRSPFEEDLVFKVSKSRAKILHQINKALKETHL